MCIITLRGVELQRFNFNSTNLLLKTAAITHNLLVTLRQQMRLSRADFRALSYGYTPQRWAITVTHLAIGLLIYQSIYPFIYLLIHRLHCSDFSSIRAQGGNSWWLGWPCPWSWQYYSLPSHSWLGFPCPSRSHLESLVHSRSATSVPKDWERKQDATVTEDCPSRVLFRIHALAVTSPLSCKVVEKRP